MMGVGTNYSRTGGELTEAHGPERTTLTWQGRELEYEDVPGDAGLAPLVLLHEGLGSVGLWRGLHRTLAEATGRRTIAYSRLGHGYSDPPAGQHTPRFMHHEAHAVLPALLDQLGVAGPMLAGPILVGHSDGASIALLHAAAHPVSGVVALAPHVFVEECSLAGIREARRQFTEGGLRARMARHHRDVDLTFHLWNDIWLDPEFRDWSIEPELAGIIAPVLVVQGNVDQYGTVAHTEAIERSVRGSVRVLLLDGDHWPHQQHQASTVRAIAEFSDPVRHC
jgi:pimeloyl-ACP methyl ester carboxylesterase